MGRTSNHVYAPKALDRGISVSGGVGTQKRDQSVVGETMTAGIASTGSEPIEQ